MDKLQWNSLTTPNGTWWICITCTSRQRTLPLHFRAANQPSVRETLTDNLCFWEPFEKLDWPPPSSSRSPAAKLLAGASRENQILRRTPEDAMGLMVAWVEDFLVHSGVEFYLFSGDFLGHVPCYFLGLGEPGCYRNDFISIFSTCFYPAVESISTPRRLSVLVSRVVGGPGVRV